MCLSDADVMFKNWTSDERVCKYLSWLPHQSIEDTKSFIEMNLNQYDNLDFYSWLIIHKQTSQAIVIIGMSITKLMSEAGLTNQKQYCSFACYSILDYEYKTKRKSS